VVLGVSACAPGRVQTTQAYAGPATPRPERVVVYEFAVTALAGKLRAYGLPVQQTASSHAGGGNEVPAQGQIVSINEGNRTRHTLIGLGAGKSSVTADAQLHYVATASRAPRLLTGFEGAADSGRAPGMAETLGVGAAADRAAAAAGAGAGLHGVSEARRTGDEENAAHLADGLAKQIGALAISQGWIPPGSVQQLLKREDPRTP
jgi:hypothetical protein